MIYRNFLEQELPLLLEDVALDVRHRTMWFQHDGCPAHFSAAAREILDRVITMVGGLVEVAQLIGLLGHLT